MIPAIPHPITGETAPVTLGHGFGGIIEEIGGGMSNHIVAPEEHFYFLPDHVSLECAALIEPLAVAWHATSVSPFKLEITS